MARPAGRPRAGAAAPYEELFDLAPDGYVATDRDGVITLANRAFARLVGRRSSGLRGTALASLIDERSRGTFEQLLVRVGSSAPPATAELELAARSKTRDVAVSVRSQTRAPDDLQLLWLFRDIRERKRAEVAFRSVAAELETHVERRTGELERERALVDAVVAQLPAGLVVVDNETRQVVRWNDEARRILRRELGNETRVDDRDGLVEYYDEGRPLERRERPIVAALERGKTTAGRRLEIRRGDGTRGVIEITAAPVRDATGSIVAGVAVIHDVTVREQRDRAERDFVTNAAHELQSPLAGILSAVEVLQTGAKDAAERDVFLGHIEREVRRLVRLARALMALARAQGGYEPPRADIVDVHALLTDVAETLPAAADVEVRVDCPSDLVVTTNADLVEQVVSNLARNSAKHTQHGHITLAARPVADGVEVAVIDTGPGIPALERPRVFGRFYRGGARGDDGFGLGLAIVRAAVDALGGELDLDSTVGAGTIVRVRLGDVSGG